MSAIRIRMIVWRVIDVAVLRAVRFLCYVFSCVRFNHILSPFLFSGIFLMAAAAGIPPGPEMMDHLL